MNAIQFIKENGVDKAREVVEGAPEAVTHYGADNYWNWDGKILKRRTDNGFFINSIHGISDEWISKTVSLSDLKCLVDSIERINGCGGLHGFKTYCNRDFSQEDLQAIADYESIGGEHV